MKLAKNRLVGSSIATVLIVLYGLIFFKFANRGIYFFDQSIVYDGGYRVYLGEVPYRDFIIPIGPVTFYMLGFVFKLISGSYFWGYILATLIIQYLFTVLTYILVNRLTKSHRYALFAAFTSLFWFSFQTHTLWLDSVATFWGFVGFVLLVCGVTTKSKRKSNTLMLLAGVLTAVSILSKHNAGILWVGISLAMIAFEWFNNDRKRGYIIMAIYWLVGLVMVLTLFILFLVHYETLDTFCRFVFNNPELVSNREMFVISRLEKILTFYWFGTDRYQLVVLLIIFLTSVVIFLLRQRRLAFGALLLTGYQFAFALMTNNQFILNYMFTGIFLVIIWKEMIKLVNKRAIMLYTVKAGFGIMYIVFIAAALYLAWNSYSLDSVRNANETSNISYNGNSIVIVDERKKMYPAVNCANMLEVYDDTYLGKFQLKRQPTSDVHELISVVCGHSFYIFPESTMFYGICDTGMHSSKFLWLDRVASYETEDIEYINDDLVSASVNVDYVVLELYSWRNTLWLLNNDFDDYRQWLVNNCYLQYDLHSYCIFSCKN